MQPLYYLAGVSDAVGASVAREKLPHVFDDAKPLGHDVNRGPEGSGWLAHAARVDGRVPEAVGHYPERQTWTRIADGVWVGIDRHAPPTPDDVVRPKTFAGHRVELADGSEWTIPVVRRPDGGTNLPQRLGWSFDTQKFGATLDERYRDLWEKSGEAVEVFFRAEQEEDGAAIYFRPGGAIELARACELVVAALRLNYRIGPAEASILGLLDTTNWERALGAVVDLPTYLEAVRASKKA